MDLVRSMRRLGLGVALLLAPAALLADELVFTTEDYPPYNFHDEDGQLSGISTDVLREAVERADVQASFRLLPWARAYAAAQQQAGACVYSTGRTEEREPLFEWVGPLSDNDWAAFTHPDADVQAESVGDLHMLRVGGFRGDATSAYLESRGVDIDYVSHDALNARRLEAGRIDVWVTGSRVAPWLAQREGTGPVDQQFVFREVDLYLACHPDTDAQILARLRSALQAMEADGTTERIRGRYR